MDGFFKEKIKMDYKQKNILKRICEHNHINFYKVRFKQFRNLNEFRYFILERINPTHHIKLKGVLKKKHVHDGYYNKVINVGEIFISFALLLMFKSEFILYWLNCFILTLFIIQLCLMGNPLKVIKYNINWYRRRFRYWKNINCS